MPAIPKMLLAALAGVALGTTPVQPVASAADAPSILVQSTTSTANSGLYDFLLPRFKADTGITVHVVAVGTGQALKNARNCDGDVLLVHAKAAEEAFVADGYGIARYDLMYNDFVFVGPPDDPVGVGGKTTALGALEAIARGEAKFASRGDNSGTHKKELALWREAGIDPTAASGRWYLETGSGMGATLNLAVGSGAYAMTDRATWISFGNKGDFRILLEGDKSLFNQYGVIAVNPDKCPQVAAGPAQAFVDWLLSNRGQDAIAAYRVDGRQLFFPNAD